MALAARDYEEAVARFEEVVDRAPRSDNFYALGLGHLGLGIASYELGATKRAHHEFEAARDVYERIGERQQFAHALQGLGVVAAREGRFETGAGLLGRARRLLDEFGADEDFFWHRLDDARASARDALGDDGFEAAYAAGRDEER